jgi:hypothetical protein
MKIPTPREALDRLIFDIKALAAESEGVAGLHQNGDVAPWSDLLEGGEFSPWLGDAIADARQAMAPEVAIPGERYHEDDGPVLWWRFPVDQPPYAGTPNDSDWPGYHTHFTPLPPAPVAPTQSPNEVP